MKSEKRSAFTLIEILIVVVIMAILAATIIPQFTDSTKDAEISTAEFNLNTLRAQIELFKAQHAGTPPAYDALNSTITELTTVTTHNGSNFGPYMVAIPENTTTGNAAVAVSADDPIAAATGTTGGWIYNATTGEIRIDHTDHFGK